MTAAHTRAKQLSSDGKTYVEIAKTFNSEGIQWEGEGRDWSRGQIENLMSHGHPDGALASGDIDEAAIGDEEAASHAETIVADEEIEADKPAENASAPVKNPLDVQSAVRMSSVESPRKWHDRKWLVAAISLFVGIVMGIGMAMPDRQAAKDESKSILASAHSDASDVKSDARGDADDIVDGAKAEREKLLSGVEKDKADLQETIRASKSKLANLKGSIQTAKGELASTERTRIQKQRKVDELNRAIRSSTSLSRENAVESATSYLETQSFSCQGLIDQLSSEYGEQYSYSDATYAAKQVGLC
jgi:cell division septum initiation protein DivIVA